MKKLVIISIVVVVALIGVAFYSGMFSDEGAAAAGGAAPQGQAAGGVPAGGPNGFGGARGGGRGGRFGGGPMTVELGTAKRTQLSQQLTVVGNLVGDATVAVVPRTAGRLQEVYVRLGDSVRRGQRIAKIEDQEILEQVKQAEAAFEVSRATIRQREADLALAQTNVERSRSLFERQLLPKQTLDDNEARYQSALAQLDLSRAQNTQSQARLDELKINLANTNILSPVDGFVARRAVDPGAFVGQNAPVVDVVDIRRVRLVVNVIEKDLREVRERDEARVSVDAFPDETFTGRIARVAPVLDPTTRTASIEIEISNANYRLKPGMYARVSITTGTRVNVLVVPAAAVVDLNGRRGVFLAEEGNRAAFRAVRVGIEEDTQVEIIEGINEGDTVVTTGAGALTDGALFLVAGRGGRNGRNGGGQVGRGGDTSQGDPTGAGRQRVGGQRPGAAAPSAEGGTAAAAASVQQRFGGAPGGEAPRGDGAGRRGRRGGQAPPAN